MDQSKTKRIVTIVIGVILSVAIIFLAFSMLQNVFTRASDVKPQDVVVSEISQNSVKVSWTTGVEAQSVIEYGTSPTALNFFAPESEKTKDHSVDLTLLSQSTTYYFQIKVGDQSFDNGGIPWTFTTKGQAETQPSAITPTTVRPSPIQTLEIPDNQTTGTCPETSNCDEIKAKIGKGCETQDYFKCVKKLTGTPITTPTPTP